MPKPSVRQSPLVAFLIFWTPMVLLIVAGFWVAAHYMEPAPPKHAVIITGNPDGEYYAIAKRYADIFKANKIDLEVRPSAGSVDNYEALLKPDGDVDLAIVQGGTLSEENRTSGKLEGIASLYLEPTWVFYRSHVTLDRLSQLAGKKIAIGADGSGTQALAKLLLTASGAPAEVLSDEINFPRLNPVSAATALIESRIDAAIIVASPKSQDIHDLLTMPGIKLMSFSQAGAVSRIYPFLSSVTLYRGSIDLEKDLPATDVQLVAPAAMLVARASAHKSLVLLGSMAAADLHKYGTLLSDPGQFPTARYMEVPMAKEAQHFLDHGPSVLQRIFPFWLASFLDRMLILLLPLATLLIPIVRFAPPLYVWRTRSRIYRWYKELRAIDAQLTPDAPPADMAEHLKQINRIEDEVRSVHVPLSYMEELYHLRLHIQLLETNIRERSGT
jgi:TRAP transporter TAXI family solute receptor